MRRRRDPRNRILLLFMATLLAQLTGAARGADREPKVDAAVNAAIEFLVKQQADDGSFRLASPPRASDTAAALLALLSAGNVQDVGRHGLVVRRAIDWLISIAPDDGNFGRLDSSNIRGQSLAVFALSEAYAVEPDPQVRAKLRVIVTRAAGVILRAQILPPAKDAPGGWPAAAPTTAPAGPDLIATAWSLLALRGARNIGIEIPQASVDRGIAFISGCHLQGGGFAIAPGDVASFTSTAAGSTVAWLFQMKDASQILALAAPALGASTAEEARPPFVGAFFVAEAAMNASEPISSAGWAGCRDALLAKQDADGGWPAADSDVPNARIESTCFAILTLTRPERLLTTLER